MTTPDTAIRLVEPGDAEALTAHLVRDAEVLARFAPERPPDSYTVGGRRERIESALTSYARGRVALVGMCPGAYGMTPSVMSGCA